MISIHTNFMNTRGRKMKKEGDMRCSEVASVQRHEGIGILFRGSDGDITREELG